MKRVKWISSVAIISYILFGSLLYALQNNFLYYPTTPLAKHDLVELEFQPEKDINIKVLVLHRGQNNAVFYLGGNAEQVGHDANDLHKVLPDKTVYFINYRGYGGSSGTPTEVDLYADVLKIYDDLKQQHHEIAVIGRSLGTGVATYLAAEREISQLVLVTPYDSIENIAQNQYPLYPIPWMLRDKYDSLSRVDQIKATVLVLLAENDQITETWSSANLIEAFAKEKLTVTQLAGTDHISISHQSEYYQKIGHFLSQY